MARQSGKAQPCSTAEARSRRSQARKFLEVAEIAASEGEKDPEYASVSASLAVLAGIAACDAACCKALGERSRSQDHHDAERLMRKIAPGGTSASKQLRDLINLKDAAHCGFYDVGGGDLKKALRRAKSLLSFADDVVGR